MLLLRQLCEVVTRLLVLPPQRPWLRPASAVPPPAGELEVLAGGRREDAAVAAVVDATPSVLQQPVVRPLREEEIGRLCQVPVRVPTRGPTRTHRGGQRRVAEGDCALQHGGRRRRAAPRMDETGREPGGLLECGTRVRTQLLLLAVELRQVRLRKSWVCHRCRRELAQRGNCRRGWCELPQLRGQLAPGLAEGALVRGVQHLVAHERARLLEALAAALVLADVGPLAGVHALVDR
mmetsp:Transcript_614/g.1694  ORF Transcript_614/g.1694 Transcript_614/m.1694 type:complete len:236 (-) Transcript_614:155-862(-)